MRAITRAAQACFFITAAAVTLTAQSAQFNGRVTDSSGAVVPGVKITITNTQTNVLRETVTNEQGYYTIPLVQPGQYNLVAEKPGFRGISQKGVTLDVDQRATLDLKLDVGDSKQEVTVQAETPLLNTTEPSVGQVIDNKRIVDLPLNGRDYVQLALLSNGTSNPIASSRAGGFSSGGQRLSANVYLLDGVDNTSRELANAGRSAELVKPSVDAIQEFKVQTNAYSAEYGTGTGAVVNVTIKSGTNGLHGALFEFLRNEKVDAKNFFASPTAATPEFRRNQYGFAVGGPIIKNKTFFFADWERTNIRQQQSVLSTLPTVAERGGDFSALTKAIKDPLTGQQFPGNIIPATRIDPVARTLVNLYPLPQSSALANNYLYNGPNNEDDTRYDFRIDHNFREKDSIFARASHYGRSLPAVLNLPPPAFGANGFDGTISGWNDSIGWNHTFSPSLVTQVRAAWTYSHFVRVNPASAGTGNLNAQYGIKGGNTSVPGNFSDSSISGYRQLGIGQNNPVDRNVQDRQFVTDTNWVHGAHSVKFGVNTMRIQNNILNSRGIVGSYTYNSQYTGDGIGDLLLGWPSQYAASSQIQVGLRGWLLGGYVQDDWKVTPKFTLNIGLRYEISRPFIEQNNLMSNFDMDTNPGRPQLVVAGGSYDNRALINTSLNGWEPRFGAVYQLTPKTVIRSGYGIFRTYFEPVGDAQYLISNPPSAFSVTLASSQTAPVFQLSQGAPAGLLTINNAAGGLQFSSFERNPKRAYAQQYNFNIQQQLGANWQLEVGYLGSHALHLWNRIDGNFSPPGPGNINAKRIFLSAAIPGTSIVASPLGPVYRQEWAGNSTYNALVAKIEKRFSGGLTVLSSFTWSKSIGDTCADAADGSATNCGFQNPLNLRAEKSLDNQDQRYRFVTSLLYELPYGRGRRFGGSSNAWVNGALGGWNFGTIFTGYTGLPYTLAVTGNPANTGSVNVINRPNLVGDPYSTPRTLQADFNTAAFAANKQYQYGSLGRNTMTQRGTINLDLSLQKNFRITERFNLQFRADAFNATNTPPFGVPNATLGTAGFGSITSAGTPRNLQGGLKLLF